MGLYLSSKREQRRPRHIFIDTSIYSHPNEVFTEIRSEETQPARFRAGVFIVDQHQCIAQRQRQRQGRVFATIEDADRSIRGQDLRRNRRNRKLVGLPE